MATQANNIPGSSLSTPRFSVSPWIVLIVTTLGFFMILLDTTIVNVAIPSMINGLHATLDQILWVLNAYVLVFSVLLITAGRLGDMFGPKRLFMIGLVIFTLASFLCGHAQTPNELILFRVLQAVGGALLMPQSLSIITSIFPPEKRGAAFGVWAAAAGLAAATGPTLGGFLINLFDWRAIFYVNVPLGVVAVVLVFLLMPEVTIHRRHALDIRGITLASAGLFAAIFGLIEGERYGWGRINNAGSFSIGALQCSIISIPTILLVGVLLLVAFVLSERRAEEPLLPLSLFKDRNFSISNVVSMIVAFGMFGLFLPLTIFLQSDLGLSALEAGVAMMPMPLTSMFVAPVAGRLADRIGVKWILAFGLTLNALGMGLVIWIASLHASGRSFTLPLIVAGVGMGCTFAPLLTAAMRNIAPAQAGAASGFINTVRQVGGAMGLAVVGAVLQNQLATHMRAQAMQSAAHLPPLARRGFVQAFSNSARGGLHVGRGQTGSQQALHGMPVALVHQVQILGREVFRVAYLAAMKPSLFFAISVILLGAFVSLFISGSREGMRERRIDERATAAVPAAGE